MPLIEPSRRRSVPAIVAFAVGALCAERADAAPSRVGVLGPAGSPMVTRLQRNLASMKVELVGATVSVCTRDVVTRLLGDLGIDTALCTDGDQTTVWAREGERVVLQEAIVTRGTDERAEELAAASAVTFLRAPNAKNATGPATTFTIVANGPDTASSSPSATPIESAAPPAKDAPPSPAKPAPSEHITPRLVLGVGPAVAASHHGNSFAVAAEAQLGVTRHVALVPWIQFIPVNRTAEGAAGTASFRPTIFGLGFAVPLKGPSSTIVPRLGGGYGILWMHVAPETTAAGSVPRSPEDLLAPIMYANFALSVAVFSAFRVVADGMVGTSSHEMVVRLGGSSAAKWGAPIASLALRGEWVLP